MSKQTLIRQRAAELCVKALSQRDIGSMAEEERLMVMVSMIEHLTKDILKSKKKWGVLYDRRASMKVIQKANNALNEAINE